MKQLFTKKQHFKNDCKAKREKEECLCFFSYYNQFPSHSADLQKNSGADSESTEHKDQQAREKSMQHWAARSFIQQQWTAVEEFQECPLQQLKASSPVSEKSSFWLLQGRASWWQDAFRPAMRKSFKDQGFGLPIHITSFPWTITPLVSWVKVDWTDLDLSCKRRWLWSPLLTQGRHSNCTYLPLYNLSLFPFFAPGKMGPVGNSPSKSISQFGGSRRVVLVPLWTLCWQRKLQMWRHFPLNCGMAL